MHVKNFELLLPVVLFLSLLEPNRVRSRESVVNVQRLHPVVASEKPLFPKAEDPE